MLLYIQVRITTNLQYTVQKNAHSFEKNATFFLRSFLGLNKNFVFHKSPKIQKKAKKIATFLLGTQRSFWVRLGRKKEHFNSFLTLKKNARSFEKKVHSF